MESTREDTRDRLGSRDRQADAFTSVFRGPAQEKRQLRPRTGDRGGTGAIHLFAQQERTFRSLEFSSRGDTGNLAAPDLLERGAPDVVRFGHEKSMISSPEPLLSLKLSVNYPRKGKVLRDLALERLVTALPGRVPRSYTDALVKANAAFGR